MNQRLQGQFEKNSETGELGQYCIELSGTTWYKMMYSSIKMLLDHCHSRSNSPCSLEISRTSVGRNKVPSSSDISGT